MMNVLLLALVWLSGAEAATAAERQAYLKSLAGIWPTLAGEDGVTLTIKEDGSYTKVGPGVSVAGTTEVFDIFAVDDYDAYWQTKRVVSGQAGSATATDLVVYSLSRLKDGNLYQNSPGTNQATGWAPTNTALLYASGRTTVTTTTSTVTTATTDPTGSTVSSAMHWRFRAMISSFLASLY